MKAKKIILRILCFPLVALIMLINSLLYWILSMYNYVRYGGETIIYKSHEKASILGIFEMLEYITTTGDYTKLVEHLENTKLIFDKISDQLNKINNDRNPS